MNSLATAHNGGDLYLRERYVGFYHGYDTDQLNKNIAFRTGSDNLGYANVSWFVDSKSLVINSAYLETVIDAPITVGDTGVSAAPEPSRALLALVGLGGVALRRRRKQAA